MRSPKRSSHQRGLSDPESVQRIAPQGDSTSMVNSGVRYWNCIQQHEQRDGTAAGDNARYVFETPYLQHARICVPAPGGWPRSERHMTEIFKIACASGATAIPVTAGGRAYTWATSVQHPTAATRTTLRHRGQGRSTGIKPAGKDGKAVNPLAWCSAFVKQLSPAQKAWTQSFGGAPGYDATKLMADLRGRVPGPITSISPMTRR